jgi:hypothetical protein
MPRTSRESNRALVGSIMAAAVIFGAAGSRLSCRVAVSNKNEISNQLDGARTPLGWIR